MDAVGVATEGQIRWGCNYHCRFLYMVYIVENVKSIAPRFRYAISDILVYTLQTNIIIHDLRLSLQ